MDVLCCRSFGDYPLLCKIYRWPLPEKPRFSRTNPGHTYLFSALKVGANFGKNVGVYLNIPEVLPHSLAVFKYGRTKYNLLGARHAVLRQMHRRVTAISYP